LLHDFNSDNPEYEPLQTDKGPIDIDWFSTLKASSLPGQAFANYAAEKYASIVARLLGGGKVTNYWP
jgi:hypothetical protein